MSKYYNPNRIKNVSNPEIHGGKSFKKAFKISRPKIDLIVYPLSRQ